MSTSSTLDDALQKGFAPQSLYVHVHCTKKTIHQLTTMPTTSKYFIFPGPNHLLSTGTDDPSLELSPSLAIRQ